MPDEIKLATQQTANQKFRNPNRERSKAGSNTVFVGQKPVMSYVLAVITQFSDGEKQIHVKARGNSISKAVDVAEVVKNKFLKGVKTKVEISTDSIEGERGKMNVSVIDIILSKD